MVRGRQSEYSIELAREFCDALAIHDGGLRTLCDKEAHYPALSTVFKWLRINPEFVEMYSQARDLQLRTMAEDITDIANDPDLDPNDKRIRISTRQWLLAKLKHRTYGDKLDLTSGGEALAAPSHQVDARVVSIVMQAQIRKAIDPEILAQLDDNALKLLE